MNKIKICYVINSLRKCGPVEVLLNQIKAIDKSKYHITILTLIDENDNAYISNYFSDYDIINFNYPKAITTLFQFTSIARKINSLDFDILHIHGHVTTFLVHSAKCKKIVTVHNRLYEDFKDVYGSLLGILVHYFNLYFLKKVDKVVFCSESSYDFGKKYLSNSTFIRNGIFSQRNTESQLVVRKKIRNDLKIPSDGFLYIYAGVLTDRKNIKKMIDFFSKKISPNEYLVVLGTGKYFDYLKDFESTQIKIIGFKKNVIDYMFASDCYVSFSQSEGFPISVIEALSCNLKLLVSDIPSHKEFFELNRDSYLGEFFNENDLPQKFCLIRKNEKISSRLIYENYLTNSIMMNAYQKLYYNLYVFGD